MKAGNDAQHWAAVLSTFDEIVDLDADSLRERLAAIGGADLELRRSLEELFAGDANADARLARIESGFGSPVAAGMARQRDADPLKLVGRTVSHFRVIELLASGGMGVVYRAEDIRLRRAIALKFPLPSHLFDRSAKERFLHEARLVGAFDHPNVCGIYEAGETDDGHLFHAMPLYDGETLKTRLARDGALPISDALTIARQLAHGLSAAHKAGIVHRDLKPANVMLLPDGGVKILDFGLAKASDLSLTASRMRLGTVSYMAPEQVHGHEVDRRTDLWALGVVLYEMLTGRRPFEGAHDLAVAYAIVHNEAVQPSALRREIEGPVDDVVRRLLCKDPAGRPPSAADVAAAFVAIPIDVPDRPVRRSLAAAARHSRLRARAAVPAVALLVALAVGAWLVRDKTASATTDPRAYELYLRGRDAELRGLPPHFPGRMPIENILEAQSLYARARDLDPSFALARARLARMLMYGAAAYDTTQARREQARLEAETALRLQPGLPEAHSALSAYWRLGVGDLPKAIEQLELAVAELPNSADLHIELGNVYRDVGRWEDAVAHYERAMQLDPGSARAPTEAAFTLVRLRRDEEAMRAFDRAIELAPDAHMLKVIKGHTYLRWKGTADTLAAVLRNIPSDWDPDGMTTWARYTVLRVERRDREALGMLAGSRSQLSRDGLVYQPIALMRAQSYDALGERAQARVHYEAARAVLADSVEAHPGDASMRVTLGLAYAGLGRKLDAIREARQAMTLVPLSQNNPSATAFMGVAVEVFGRVGELDEAFKLLELLLAIPAGREVTIPFLRVWPGFDPLRSDPRFQQLLERFAIS